VPDQITEAERSECRYYTRTLCSQLTVMDVMLQCHPAVWCSLSWVVKPWSEKSHTTKCEIREQ